MGWDELTYRYLKCISSYLYLEEQSPVLSKLIGEGKLTDWGLKCISHSCAYCDECKPDKSR